MCVLHAYLSITSHSLSPLPPLGLSFRPFQYKMICCSLALPLQIVQTPLNMVVHNRHSLIPTTEAFSLRSSCESKLLWRMTRELPGRKRKSVVRSIIFYPPPSLFFFFSPEEDPVISQFGAEVANEENLFAELQTASGIDQIISENEKLIAQK